MAEGFKHPKSKVHVGDGFKFLEDYKNEFDVIITDSSDPEGPAESLFKKPYFELLFGALKEGGVISTQGCQFSFFRFVIYQFTRWLPYVESQSAYYRLPLFVVADISPYFLRPKRNALIFYHFQSPPLRLFLHR